MYHHEPGLYLNTFGNRGDAAVGYVPLDGTEPGIVLGVNFNNERVDVTGNHVMNNSTLYTAAKSYDGLRHMAELPGDSASRIFNDSGTAHRIATANPVSYGGMFFLALTQPVDNTQLISSSVTVGSTNQNYGMRYKVSQNAMQRTPGAVNASFAPPLNEHFHIVVVENAGRTSAKWYINGALQDTTAPTATGANPVGETFWVGELAGAASVSASGWASDIFVSSLELNATQILQFATNAFGGTPPAFP